jgi:TPR repeat protein
MKLAFFYLLPCVHSTVVFRNHCDSVASKFYILLGKLVENDRPQSCSFLSVFVGYQMVNIYMKSKWESPRNYWVATLLLLSISCAVQAELHHSPCAEDDLDCFFSQGMITFLDPSKEAQIQSHFWLQKAAEAGHAPAQNHLAVLLSGGQFMPDAQPTPEALEWFRKSAEGGYVLGQNAMGVCYMNGNGCPIDFDLARGWFEKAAEQGNSRAIFNLGLMYRDGLGVEVDEMYAVRLFHLAYEASDYEFIEASYELARTLRYSERALFEGQIRESVMLFRALAEDGHPDSQFEYAYALAHGAGVKEDKALAVAWYLKSAEGGVANAMDNLSVMYARGWGVEENPREAQHWAMRAALAGHVGAQAKVGLNYLRGYGVEESITEAYLWFLLADRNGHLEIRQFLKKAIGDDYLEQLSDLMPLVNQLQTVTEEGDW